MSVTRTDSARALLVLTFLSTLAAGEVYTVVPESSKVEFAVTSTLDNFTGTATVRAGVIRLGAGNAAGFISVGSTSMGTGNAGRDRHLHTDVVHSATHPAIRFDLTSVERTETTLTATGTWVMHGLSRPLSIPFTMVPPTAVGEPARLRASIALDIRQWGITPPRTAFVLTVDPIVRVSVDLALAAGTDADLPPSVPAAAATPTVQPILEVDAGSAGSTPGPLRTANAGPPPAAVSFAGITLTDHLGVAHDLGAEARGRLLILFDIDCRHPGKRWDDLLSQHLPAARHLIRVLDGSRVKPEDHARLIGKVKTALEGTGALFLMDWTGEVRKRTAAPTDRPILVATAADGTVCGQVDGEPTGANQTAALKLIGIVPAAVIPDPAPVGGKSGAK